MFLKESVKFYSLILTLLLGLVNHAQKPDAIVKEVNDAVDSMEYIHFNTHYISKYYAREDTTQSSSETWIYKTESDTILGMHIRTVTTYDSTVWETFHQDLTTWLINHSSDSITRYDQSKAQWDGFSGNTKSSWTTDTPLTLGIYVDEEDSLSTEKLENGDWLIKRFSPDDLDYGIHSITKTWWIDQSSMIPYKTVGRWKLGDRETYNELNIELLDTNPETIKPGLYQPLPNYTMLDYVAPDPDQYKPLKVGAAAPEMIGHYLKDSSTFDIQEYMKDHLIMVDFWYQTCAPCIQAIPYLDSLDKEFADEDFLLFEVNSNDYNVERAKLIKFLNDRGGTIDHVVMTTRDTERKQWKCYANPTFYLIKDGQIVWVQQGFGPELMNEFREKIASFLE